jgi:hypothetical protein
MLPGVGRWNDAIGHREVKAASGANASEFRDKALGSFVIREAARNMEIIAGLR